MTRLALEGFDGREGSVRSLGTPRGRTRVTMAGSWESQHVPGNGEQLSLCASRDKQREEAVGRPDSLAGRDCKDQTERLSFPSRRETADRPLGAEKCSPSEPGFHGAPPASGEVGGREWGEKEEEGEAISGAAAVGVGANRLRRLHGRLEAATAKAVGSGLRGSWPPVTREGFESGSITEQPGFSSCGPASGLWSQTSPLDIAALPPTSWASGQLSNLINPPGIASPICKMGIMMVPPSWGCPTDTVGLVDGRASSKGHSKGHVVSSVQVSPHTLSPPPSQLASLPRAPPPLLGGLDDGALVPCSGQCLACAGCLAELPLLAIVPIVHSVPGGGVTRLCHPTWL